MTDGGNGRLAAEEAEIVFVRARVCVPASGHKKSSSIPLLEIPSSFITKPVCRSEV